MDSEIVCPFCDHGTPLMGTRSRQGTFRGPEPISLYDCPCGAVGFTSPTIDDPSWDVRPVKEVLCRIELRSEPDDCDVGMNCITNIDPPMRMLWVKRRRG